MATQYKSLETVTPQAWVEHFKSTVGKTSLWNEKPKMVVLRHPTGAKKPLSSDSLPLNIVSPVEQYANMAQTGMTKSDPRYTAPSVSGKPSKSGGRSSGHKRKRKPAKKSSAKIGTVKRDKKEKKQKTDIFG